MISISPFKSASVGSSYFDKDSYYTNEEETSGWYGRGAQSLSLNGVVRKEEFDRIINGFDLDGNVLVKNAGSKDTFDEKGKIKRMGRRAYVDVTFSAPKSVSIMSYIDKRIEAAHNRAAERTIGELERRYAHTRLVEESELHTVRTDNLCMARFNHYESRELDPQLHSHVVVMNLTQGEDGKWRSIEAGDLFKNQLYAGQFYRNELAKELRGLGYEIEATDRNKGFYEIRGVDKEVIAEFSTRRKQIEAHLAKNQDYYKTRPTSNAKMYEQAALDSRRPKTDAKIEEIRQDVEKRLGTYGLSLESIKARALEKEKKPAEFTAEQCLSLALEEITDKQSGFRMEEVLALAMKVEYGHYSAEELKDAFETHHTVKLLGAQEQYAGVTKTTDAVFYTTEEILTAERGIVDRANEGRGRSGVAVSKEMVKSHIEDLRVLETPIELTKGQTEALEMICTTKDRISLVQGDAGAGKSFACEQVHRLMEKAGITVRGFTPTGIASVPLNIAKIETRTVDSFLESASFGKPGVGKNELWLVDEAGMMGSLKLERFLKEAEKNDAKVVLIGDRKQFQAVQQGKIFHDLQEHAGVSKAEITEVKRQQTEHAKQIVKDIKDRNFDSVFSKLEEIDALKEVENRDDRIQQIAGEYMNDRKTGIASVVLTSTNADRNEINREIRSRLEKEGALQHGQEYRTFQKANLNAVSRNFAESYQEGQRIVFSKDAGEIVRGTLAEVVGRDEKKHTLTIKYFDKKTRGNKETEVDCRTHAAKLQVYDVAMKKFGVGDRIMFQKNDKNVGVKNGETGVIKSIDEHSNAVVGIGEEKRGDYREVLFNLNNRGDKAYNYCDHAYCITSHKSQGATIDKVIVNADVSNHRTNFNEFYVQATRQKRDVSIYTNDKQQLKEQVQEEQNKISTLDEFMVDFSKHETAIDEKRHEIEKETDAFLTNAMVFLEPQDEVQEKEPGGQKEKGPVSFRSLMNLDDLEKSIKTRYSITLSPSSLSTIKINYEKGRLNLDKTHTLICSAIDQTKNENYSWHITDSKDFYAACTKNPNAFSRGDIVIKKVEGNDEKNYEAFRVVESNSLKYLGSDKDFADLKSRTEQYVFIMAISDKINESLGIAPKEPPLKPVEKVRDKPGMDI